MVISSGRIEGLIKYQEVVFDLYQQGYSVFIHDHRGQGFSGRLTTNPQQGYVDSFDDYVHDLQTFLERVVLPNSHAKPLLLCHSMGGAIGSLHCLTYPDTFAKVAFCAPMFGIRPALPDWMGKVFAHGSHWLANTFSDQPQYIAGQGDYESVSFAENRLTHSEIRYQIFRDLYENYPQAKLGGVTSQWLVAAVAAMDEIEVRANQLVLPALMLQAGADEVVDNQRQDKVFAQFPNAQKRRIEDSKHEILMESDRYRVPAMQAILTFFNG